MTEEEHIELYRHAPTNFLRAWYIYCQNRLDRTLEKYELPFICIMKYTKPSEFSGPRGAWRENINDDTSKTDEETEMRVISYVLFEREVLGIEHDTFPQTISK